MSTATTGRDPRTAPRPEASPAPRGIGARLGRLFSRGSASSEAAGPGYHSDGPRRWPWILALVLMVLLLAGAVYGVFFSPVLGVTSVSIAGAPDSVSAKVRAVVDVPDGTAADVRYHPDRSTAAAFVAGLVRGGDMVITMGAGDVTTVGPELLTLLEAQ